VAGGLAVINCQSLAGRVRELPQHQRRTGCRAVAQWIVGPGVRHRGRRGVLGERGEPSRTPERVEDRDELAGVLAVGDQGQAGHRRRGPSSASGKRTLVDARSIRSRTGSTDDTRCSARSCAAGASRGARGQAVPSGPGFGRAGVMRASRGGTGGAVAGGSHMGSGVGERGGGRARPSRRVDGLEGVGSRTDTRPGGGRRAPRRPPGRGAGPGRCRPTGRAHKRKQVRDMVMRSVGSSGRWRGFAQAERMAESAAPRSRARRAVPVGGGEAAGRARPNRLGARCGGRVEDGAGLIDQSALRAMGGGGLSRRRRRQVDGVRRGLTGAVQLLVERASAKSGPAVGGDVRARSRTIAPDLVVEPLLRSPAGGRRAGRLRSDVAAAAGRRLRCR